MQTADKHPFFSGREILQLKPEEMKAISAIVSGDDAAKDKAFADGLFIAGSRYVVARADGRSIYARSVRQRGAWVSQSCGTS